MAHNLSIRPGSVPSPTPQPSTSCSPLPTGVSALLGIVFTDVAKVTEADEANRGMKEVESVPLGEAFDGENLERTAAFQHVARSIVEGVLDMAIQRVPSDNADSAGSKTEVQQLPDSGHIQDPPPPPGPIITPLAGTSTCCHDNPKKLKFILSVDNGRKSTPPFGAMRSGSRSDFSQPSSPPPTIYSSPFEEAEGEDEDKGGNANFGLEDEEEEEISGGEEEGGIKYNVIGDDGLLNVFALRQDLNRRLSCLNKRFRKFRARQETVRRLLNYIQRLIKETETVNSMLALSRDQIEALAKEASNQRDELANACDLAAETVGKTETQILKLEPACYRRYLNIGNTADCNNLLSAVRSKRKALGDLEILIYRRQLIQQNSLPVKVDDPPGTKQKTSMKRLGRINKNLGNEGCKVEKIMMNKSLEFKPIVLEIIAPSVTETGASSSNTTCITEMSTTTASSDTPLSLLSTPDLALPCFQTTRANEVGNDVTGTTEESRALALLVHIVRNL